MNLIVVLCLLCGWVAPHACRSVDVHDPPSEDLEPFVAHHHHEGNIAELLIPLLERSLAQSEARSNERQHRRNKPGKKVIQVLPYRGSEEHKRKGWRKLNSHKKQVVEITPLHGKNKAKPLAYILSAAKPSHGEHVKTNDDVSSVSASGLEHDKSTSEEQQSSEENREDSEDVNTLKEVDSLSSPSVSSNLQSSEDVNSQSKDLSASDKEYSAGVSVESIAEVNADKSETGRKVVIEESEDESTVKSKIAKKHTHTTHVHKSGKLGSTEHKAVTIEDAGLTVEDAVVTVEDTAVSLEDAGVIVEGAGVTVEDADVTVENRAVTVENADVTVENADVIENADVTVDNVDVTVENKAATVEEVGVTVEDAEVTAEDAEVTVDDKAVTVEEAAVIVEDAVGTDEDEALAVEEGNKSQEGPTVIDNNAAVTAEDAVTVAAIKQAETTLTLENADDTVENADVSVENDVTVERKAAGQSDSHTEHTHRHTLVHPHHVVSDFQDLNHLIDNLNLHNEENEYSSEHSRNGFIENDIVISRGHHENDSAEKSISKLFNARARDIIELIQSSVEASTAAQRDCLEAPQKHHDHKSYRLSFLFNK